MDFSRVAWAPNLAQMFTRCITQAISVSLIELSLFVYYKIRIIMQLLHRAVEKMH